MPIRQRRRSLWGFFAFSHGWTWSFWGLATLWGASIWEPPALYLFVIGGAGVMLGGIVMSRVAFGPAGVRDLGRRIVDPRRIPLRWWAVILVFFPALTLAAGGVALALGATQAPLDVSGAVARLTDPVGLAGMAAFILVVGPLPEEIGWRGYLLDRLQARWSALAASLLVGGVWWAWHLPLFVLPGYFDAFGRAAPHPLDFLYAILPAAILYTWVYNNTRRSVLAVILFHFMENFSGEIFHISDEARQYRLALMVGLVSVVVWWWGPASLRRDRPRP